MPGGGTRALKRSLPTLDKLGVQAPENVNAIAVAESWLESFAQSIKGGDVVGAGWIQGCD